MMRSALWAILFLFCSNANAEVIRFPEEELATETVLPVFERAPMVKNRKVKTAGRIEVGGGLGFNLTEALYNKTNFGLTGTYHFDEFHGANIAAWYILPGLSDKGEQLKRGEGLTGGQVFQADLAPSPSMIILGNYQYTAYYGKISLAKNYVMNLSIFGIGGLGAVNFGDSTNIAANVGVGQKFYFHKDLAFRFDLRFLAYQGPDPTSDSNKLQTGAKRSSSDLSTTTYFHTVINFGLVYLL